MPVMSVAHRSRPRDGARAEGAGARAQRVPATLEHVAGATRRMAS